MDIQEKDNQDVKSKKDLLLERLRGQHPDLNTDDEDALYGTINDNFDNFEQYKTEREAADSKRQEVDKNLSDRFNSDKQFGKFFLGAMQKDSNPVLEFLKVYGMEIKDYLDDPEKAEEIGKMQQENLERIAKGEELEENYSRNLEQSLDLIEKYQQENEMTDEQAENIIAELTKDAENVIMGIFTPQMIEDKMKSLNYSADIETAQREAFVEGKNQKIDEQKKADKEKEKIPPMIQGKQTMVREGNPAALNNLTKYYADKFDPMKGATRTPARKRR